MWMISDIISVTSAIPFIRIDKMELHAKVNEHVSMQIWGILEKESALNIIKKNMKNEMVRVILPDGQVYFAGLIIELEVKAQSGLFQVYMTCISATFLLDVYSYDRSYQDVEQSYKDVIRKALKTENALFVSGKEAEQPIKEPVFQYCETEWKFLLRMANNLQTYVVANYRVDYPAFALGKIKDQEVDWEIKNYTVGYTENNGKIYVCISREQRNIGDYVFLDGHILMIVEKHSVFQNGEFVNTYTLGSRQGFAAKSFRHSLKGCQLRGIVLDTDGERIKLHLEIDEFQDIDKAYWFNYVPQSGNVMYSMPQKGTKAMLRFCSDRDNSAVVETCWRENGDKCQEMSDYHNRYFTTEHGKRMGMLPKAIFFENGDNRLDLTDSLGILLHSDKHIKMTAEGRIDIIASHILGLKGSRHIYITKPNNQSVIDFAGDEINIDSINTNLNIKNVDVNKPYKSYNHLTAVSIKNRLARKVLAFVPKKSGKEIL